MTLSNESVRRESVAFGQPRGVRGLASSSKLVTTDRRRTTRLLGVRAVRAVGALAVAAMVGVSLMQPPSVAARRRVSRKTTTTRLGVTVSSSPKPGSQPSSAVTAPMIGGCPVFAADNAWNTDVSTTPVHPNSATWVASVNSSRTTLHPDVGSNPDYGIPYVVVASGVPRVPVRYTDYGDESDPGPFPIPANAPVEAGSDRHVIVVQSGSCELFELFNAQRDGAGWSASSGARYDLRANTLRPAGWTSADAAGLPILPGLLRYDEVASGEIRHALRFTASKTQRAYLAPARHQAGRADPTLPPMGARFRLRADADLSRFRGHALVVLTALKRYGMIVADNGSSWFISGATDPRWNDEDLDQLKTVPGSWFEVVDSGPMVVG